MVLSLYDTCCAVRMCVVQTVLKQDELDVEILRQLTGGRGAGPHAVFSELSSAAMGGL
jgi:hypothetical protein